MNYTILSLNDERKKYKDRIRERVGFKEIPSKTFDAYSQDPIEDINRRRLVINRDHWLPKLGELGVWLSNLNAWGDCLFSNEPLIVFEDDAIPHINFNNIFEVCTEALPADWDFFALWVPEDQAPDYNYDVTFDRLGRSVIHGRTSKSIFAYGSQDTIAKVYQGYGNVAIAYSPKGAGKLIELAIRDGLYAPVDCWLMMQSRRNLVNGFAPHPNLVSPVTYDWSAPTTIHTTKEI